MNAKRRASVEKIDDLDRTLSALSDPQRREVIDMLRERSRSAGELARLAGISAPAMSRHLKTLRTARLVAEEHGGLDARVRIYRLTPEPMSALKAWMEETEQLWTKQLLSFKAHIEKTRRGR